MAFDVPDDWGLAGKVAIVTGGGAAGDGIGNGRAAAILLAKAGARVVVVDRDKALAGRTVEMIREVKGEAIALEADVTQARDCAAMVQAALDTFGRLDLLDNNVGIGSRGSVVDEPEETWRRVMRVNGVAPGPVYTPMVYQRGMSDRARERRRTASLLKIEGTGWDIGHAVRYLLSDYARYVTGHVLVVDGGTTVTAPERDSQ